MILIDSCFWIDYFRGNSTLEAELLDGLLGRELVATGDLILLEVLQGFPRGQDFQRARKLMAELEIVELGGVAAVQAATNFRKLRESGVTVRKSIDTLIATRCIEDGLALLHSDRDFDAFERHLRLRVVGRGR